MKYSVYNTWTIVSGNCLSIDNIYTDKDLADKDCAENAKNSRDMLRKNHKNMSEEYFESYYKAFDPHYVVMTVDDAIAFICGNVIDSVTETEF